MLEELEERISKNGGFVNAHSHLDRANTSTLFNKQEQYKFLKEKWQLVDKVKTTSTKFDYLNRINKALLDQIELGVTHVCSFIDVDSVVGEKAIISALELSEEDRVKSRIKTFIATQTLKGVLDPNERELVKKYAQKAHIIGSLPAADAGHEEEHLDTVMLWAKEYNKRLHVHVDQLNTSKEKETELLARKTMQWGHPKHYRNDVYKMSRDAGLSFVSCPSAWIDHPRREDMAPIHNSITPVDELIKNDLIVALGSDNIYDVYKPFCNGDMMFELRMLLEACKIYDEDQLVKIATSNGKKVLGIEED